MTTTTINRLIGGNIVITTGGSQGSPKTRITFTDGTTEEYDWSGEITQQTMIGAGLYMYDGSSDKGSWIKEP